MYRGERRPEQIGVPDEDVKRGLDTTQEMVVPPAAASEALNEAGEWVDALSEHKRVIERMSNDLKALVDRANANQDVEAEVRDWTAKAKAFLEQK